MRYIMKWVRSFPAVVDTVENKYAPFGCLESAEGSAQDFEKLEDNPERYEWEPLPQEAKK